MVPGVAGGGGSRLELRKAIETGRLAEVVT